MPSTRLPLLACIAGGIMLLVLIRGSQCARNIAERPQTTELEGTQESEEDRDHSNRDKRFARILTCHTDLHCRGLDRLACCVKSEHGDFRVCKPLGALGAQCNMHIKPHLWEGVRGGWTCPCMPGLECVETSRTSVIGQCI